jgi:hypothetical protein
MERTPNQLRLACIIFHRLKLGIEQAIGKLAGDVELRCVGDPLPVRPVHEGGLFGTKRQVGRMSFPGARDGFG